MIREVSEQSALAAVGAALASWTDLVVPGQVEALPTFTYSPVYAWMFAYEKALKSRIETVLGRPLGAWAQRLFGSDGAFSEALSNAFLHGHRRAAELAITVRSTVGANHLFFAISDQGAGFDVAGVLAARKRRSNYFHVAGNGLRCLEEAPWVTAWWVDSGRTLLLLVDLTA